MVEPNGTQKQSPGAWGSENFYGIQLDSNKHSSCEGVSQEGENQSVGGGGETSQGEFTLESIRTTFISYTGKILEGLLVKSENDKRIWEDRLQEARDCIDWYQDLIEKCEKEISLADSQLAEVENMLSQLKEQ